MESSQRNIQEELQILINKRLVATVEQLIRFPILLYSYDGRYYKPKGTGIFLHYKEFLFILTATHVINDREPLFTNIGDKIVPVREFRHLRGVSDLQANRTIDIGWITLTVDFARELAQHRAHLTMDDLIDHNPHDYDLSMPMYMFTGFPASMNMKVESPDTKISFDFTAIHVAPIRNSEAVFNYLHLDRFANMAFTLSGKAPEIIRNIPKFRLPELNGMSGSAIWWLFYNPKEEELEFNYKVIGLFSDYRNGKYHCAVGSRISIVMENIEAWDKLGLFDLSPSETWKMWSVKEDNRRKFSLMKCRNLPYSGQLKWINVKS